MKNQEQNPTSKQETINKLDIEIASLLNNESLSDEEKKELEVLMKYLPEQISEDEIRKIVKDKIEELNISTGKSEAAGKLMGAIMPQLKGKADGSLVSKIVSEELK